MASALETGYHPDSNEETTEISQTTVTIKSLHKDYFFLREPYMPLREFGYVAVTWTGPYMANFDYYVALTNGNPNAKHDAENVMKTWVNDDTPNPDTSNKNIFACRWSTHAIFYKPDNAFVLGSKNDNGIFTLIKVITAQSPESVSLAKPEVKFEPRNLYLDPIADAFFDSMEKAGK
jgi:hypothetical protein